MFTSFQRWLTLGLLLGQLFLRLGRLKPYGAALREQLTQVGPPQLPILLWIHCLGAGLWSLSLGHGADSLDQIDRLGELFARSFCPQIPLFLSSLVMATQVTSRHALELAQYRREGQWDMLRSLHIHPLDYLVMPRLLACAIMLPILTGFGLGLSIVVGGLVAFYGFQLPMVLFFTDLRQYLPLGLLGIMGLKTVGFGSLMALIGCAWGLSIPLDPAPHDRRSPLTQLGYQASLTAWGTLFCLGATLA